MEKNVPDAFTATDQERWLHRRAIRQLLIVGVITNNFAKSLIATLSKSVARGPGRAPLAVMAHDEPYPAVAQLALAVEQHQGFAGLEQWRGGGAGMSGSGPVGSVSLDQARV